MCRTYLLRRRRCAVPGRNNDDDRGAKNVGVFFQAEANAGQPLFLQRDRAGVLEMGGDWDGVAGETTTAFNLRPLLESHTPPFCSSHAASNIPSTSISVDAPFYVACFRSETTCVVRSRVLLRTYFVRTPLVQ